MECHVNKPYPKLKVEKKNKKFAQILSHLYASNESELSAIHQYTFQMLVTEDKGICNILKQISIVEMQHLNMLGQTIRMLGCNPILAEYKFNKIRYWNSNDIYYDTDIKTILEIDIEQEQKNILNYHMVLNVIDDIYVKSLLERILEDEYLHLEIFKKLYYNVCKEKY